MLPQNNAKFKAKGEVEMKTVKFKIKYLPLQVFLKILVKSHLGPNLNYINLSLNEISSITPSTFECQMMKLKLFLKPKQYDRKFKASNNERS